MDLKDFIYDALINPSDLISYEVSRKLQELYPNRTVIEGAIASFDLLGYVRAGHCLLVNQPSIHNKHRVILSNNERSLDEWYENSWFNVLWREHLLDVLLLTWTEDGWRERHHFIIADSRGIAEEFLKSVCDWGSQVSGEVLVFEGGRWYKDQELFDAIESASFDALILPAVLRRELREDFGRFLSSRELYQKYGIPWRRGVILIGPPGNGKTQTVKAIINESNKPCLYVKSFKACWGTDHDAIREVFKRARKTAPCIVVLEDLDSLVRADNRSFFLNELDGFAENTGVLVLATTNHADKLDPAILDRPGRFDRKYYFDLPTFAGRLAYLNKWNEALAPELRCPEGRLRKVADMTEGFSFAYLKEACVSSLAAWVNDRSESMSKVLHRTAKLLRQQMSPSAEGKRKKKARAAAGGCELWS